jgi:hypothetical protein
MSDVRSQLERLSDHIHGSADAFERLERRRRRRVRNRRAGAIVVALAIALGGTTGAIVAFRGGGHVPASDGASAFAPIWPDSTVADAQAAQDAYAGDPSSLPAWRTDGVRTAVEFARVALGWGDALATKDGIEVTADGLERVTVETPPPPCPSPTAGSIAPWCGGKQVAVDLRQLATDGPWWVVGVRGRWMPEVAFDTDANGDATAFRFDANLPMGVTYENALVGVGACRGWEVDSRREPMLLRGGSLPLLPSRFADGCDAVFVAIGLPTDPTNDVTLPPDVPTDLGQQILFGGASPDVAILDAFAEPIHLPAAVGGASANGSPTLHVRCDGDIALDANTVAAASDGAHVTITDEILDQDATVSVAATDGSEPRPAETVSAQGTVHEVWPFAPGTYTVTCAYPAGPAGPAHQASASFSITDPSDDYRSTVLGCSSGSGYGVAQASSTDGPPAGEPGDPMRLVREHLTGMASSDSLTALGYPDQLEPVVGVVRDGSVVATVRFANGSDGLAFSELEGCGGTHFNWDGVGAPATGATGPAASTGSTAATGSSGSASGSGVVGVLCGGNGSAPSADLLVDVIRVEPSVSFGPCIAPHIELNAPANTRLRLRFSDEDPDVPRNLSIYAMTPCLETALGGDSIGCDPGAPRFRGETIDGKRSNAEIVYDVPPLAAGRYWIQDDLHPGQVYGVLVVVEVPSAAMTPSPTP